MGREHEEIRIALLEGASSAGADLAAIDRDTLFFVESELVEDFLEGSLSDEESELFRTNYLVTDERRDLLNEVRLLKRFSSGSIKFDAEEFERENPPEESLPGRPVVAIAILAFAALLLLAFLVYYYASA
ncbi:MAG TPA: hypothetical protein VFZ49_00355 [Pyrinomonadaceae bacterium]